MKIILSGIKPSGIPTLGNYIGALKNFVSLQEEMKDFEFFVFVADLHAITVPHDVEELRQNIRSVAALYLASGLSVDNLSLFVQSEVHEHAELGYILQTISYMGELERMTQYKDKAKQQKSGIPAALFNYPILMAADILLYDAQYVPVGEDQKQHLELTRNLAERFNNRYGETFVVPEVLVTKTGAKIMDLQDPLKKMDKSANNEKGCIFLLEPIDTIKKKIKSSITDSESKIKYSKSRKPGISNLITIYSALTGLTYTAIEKKYENAGYGLFKNDLADIVANEIGILQEKYHKIINSKMLDDILDMGKAKAQAIAQKKIREVYNKVGLTRG
ncbi:MAG: tryptophan--tRNA ligase [Bacilli bacterium]|nr:tryptophan--tRNA ligase [Bacilli bacterium]MDD4076578.1 tryptophan--tRNA ligase [Bacilli bacterium]MDD4388159.1 tryptophan--tRNA ligase [Bacilli bacterium]